MKTKVSTATFTAISGRPFFVFVDLDTDSVETFENPDQDHQHGACNPMDALGGRRVDGVVVGGIGGGALKKLNNDGITVYRAVEGTVGVNARMIKAGNLPVFEPEPGVRPPSRRSDR